DLYYRLNVINIVLPPLRERREDIPLLAEHFLHQFAEEGSKVAFSDAALDHLSAHSWPGNARELRNAVQRALILCSQGEIQPEHLPDPKRRRPRPPREDGDAIRVEVGTSIRDAEKALILATLAACDDNRTRTAEMLGVSAKTLYNKLTAYEQAQNEGAGS
ncbi:MAG: sigma-54-dependent Fis family transcriptional regulator, partial [Gemmatimonadetes bacterium]|nr:sigma-54-dependent Fis family transcriptional regulator [Gemmatimonadota bacterium]